ncbi:MAG: ABC transporter substrate-binding protein [Deltaproteobacteria bacterium]|nr:ABC transporter substrate-binding protein [Deltaproteobacteria bacterium]MBW2123953.1 ABC transporter substrate-binding protein [Deltaproteobacteria bacterium]
MSRLRELEDLLSRGKISRREFLARASALGVAAAISPSLLGGIAHGAAPKKGGRLRVGCTGGSTTDSLDPGRLTSNMNQFINFQIRNCLVEIDHNYNTIPELAESWEASPDAVTWRFKLRKGVEFHNGKTLDAGDVVFSINHHRGKESKSAAKGIVDPIEDIKADGRYTVVFKLKGGNADFPYIMSDYHLTIAPAGTSGAEWEKGIGTGGYMLQDWEPGVRAFTKRNPNYWKAGRAHFDEVETLSIVDVNARTNALKTGQIDVMDRCELKTVHLLKRVPNIQVVRVTSTTHYTMPMRTDFSPYDNNDVRLALKYAVDREQMLKTILRGYGALGNDHPIAPIQRYYASELPQRRYDPDKARYYMKKAGVTGHTFKLHAAEAAFAGAIDAAILYRESAAKAGIKIKVVREPDDGYWSNVWMKKEWCMCYWGGRATPDWMFSTAYAADANWNDTFWKNERFNELLVKARAELDDAKRREMYVEMQRIVCDEGGVVVPMFADIVEAATKKLKFENFAGSMELDGMKLAERWWFA